VKEKIKKLAIEECRGKENRRGLFNVEESISVEWLRDVKVATRFFKGGRSP
jgi:hypothetical protein